ncbi:acyl-CoA dehydrogenase family protein [Saccharopolyspora endophytica]|uniref:Acyl-CoA/acyl-ACP dehydrogenase n=1 Tax=Saccharopolyspora endophytica TaxID=543886 RepID=A0ABS5DF23_9PSEU|nr:acyl-CoA dehydrogenase family protein [Saccharopolyspora endophytica]MBQ0924893.1 acyl-CoA/acyl-ACP dehydrogenase [Saccharopolyspora endophytica]
MTTVDPELRDVLREVLAGDLHDRLDQTTGGFDAQLWERLSRLGFTALTAPEQQGGSGAGWLEAAALLSESAAAAARHLPFAESDLLAHWLLRTAGTPADDPTTPLTLAIVEPDGTARAVPWLGQVPAVLLFRRPNGTCAVAETPSPPNPDYSRNQDPENGRNRGPDHSGPPDPDYSRNQGPDYGSNPGARSGLPRGEMRGVEEPPGVVEVGAGVLDELVLRGAVARAVQVVGALDAVVRLCVEHSRSRVQFGRPIAKFQAVQHLVAEAAAEAALARAAVDAAVLDAAETGALSAVKVAAARSCAGHAVSVVVRNAHQVHGAIGTTQEHPLQLFTLPALDWRGEFGTTRDWDRFLGETTRTSSLWDVVLGGPADTPSLPGGHR